MSKVKDLSLALLTVPNEKCTIVAQWMEASRNAGDVIKVLVAALEEIESIGAASALIASVALGHAEELMERQ